MVYCFVQFCPFAVPDLRFGAKPEKGEKVTFFQCPPELGPEMFEEWYMHLPRPGFTKKSYVCEKHFLECEIHRYHIDYLKNGTERRLKLDPPYLSSSAVPRVFPHRPSVQITEPSIPTTPVVPSTEASSKKNMSKDSTRPKQTTSVVSSTQESSTENVPTYSSNFSNASIKSASVSNSVTSSVSLSNPSSSTDQKTRRSLRGRNAMKPYNKKPTSRSRRVIVSTKSPAASNEITSTESSAPASNDISHDSNPETKPPYDHTALLKDLQKVKMDWPEWSWSDAKQKTEELILLSYIDPTSGLLDKYVKVKKADLSVEGFFFSVNRPQSCLPVAAIRNETDVSKLLGFMTNAKVTFEKT